MELFLQLFGDLLDFVYHCFDRIVIHGYLSGLSRPEQVVYFFRQVLGTPVVSKEVLSQRTDDYRNWVEAFARNHKLHATYWLNGHSFIEQELKRNNVGFRKDDDAFLAVDDLAQLQGAADRLSPEIIRKQLDYWTLILGPKFSQKGTPRDEPLALLCHQPDRVLPELHLQTPLSHPQDLRAVA